MTGHYPSEVVRLICAVIAPFILVFGLYVTAHGHYGPGGGFAGGVILALGAILLRYTTRETVAYALLPAWSGPLATGLGAAAFACVGLLPLAFGGMFLEYAAVEVPGMTAAELRYYGILIVEIVIGVAVFGVLLAIFDTFVGKWGQ